MSTSLPIHALAKELNINSKRIITACKALGINAKGSTRKLNEDDIERMRLIM